MQRQVFRLPQEGEALRIDLRFKLQQPEKSTVLGGERPAVRDPDKVKRLRSPSVGREDDFIAPAVI